MREVYKDNLKIILMYLGIEGEIELPELQIHGSSYGINASIINAHIKEKEDVLSFTGLLSVLINLQEGVVELQWECQHCMMDNLGFKETDVFIEEAILKQKLVERLSIVSTACNVILHNMAIQLIEQITWLLIDSTNLLKLQILRTLMLTEPKLVLPPAEPRIDVTISKEYEEVSTIQATLYLRDFSLEEAPQIDRATIIANYEYREGKESINWIPSAIIFKESELTSKLLAEYQNQFFDKYVEDFVTDFFTRIDPLGFLTRLTNLG
jgi:hypothetical protein